MCSSSSRRGVRPDCYSWQRWNLNSAASSVDARWSYERTRISAADSATGYESRRCLFMRQPDDSTRLEHLIEAAEKAVAYAADRDRSALDTDELLRLALTKLDRKSVV